MNDLHGLILADRSSQELGELASKRTGASLPFCGRYRLIDFALSAMQNAGVRDVGVIMQRDYQSLLDHIGSGKEWDMSRKSGGLRLLPPFGQPEDKRGLYATVIDALWAVEGYIRDIRQDYVCLTRGNLAANMDLRAAIEQHLKTGAAVTALCTDRRPRDNKNGFLLNSDGTVKALLPLRSPRTDAVASLETFIMSRETLLSMMDALRWLMNPKFHRDGLGGLLAEGGRMDVYVHSGYAEHITTLPAYFDANMDMLDNKNRASLFPPERPVRTKGRSDVSTHYGEGAASLNSLVADGCIIAGSLENCVIFRGVRVAKGAALKNCVIMQDTVIGEGAELKNVIADKDVSVSPYVTLTGSPRIPLVIPKGSKI